MLVNYVPRVPNAADFSIANGGIPLCIDARNGDLYVMLTGVAPYNTIHKVTGLGGTVTSVGQSFTGGLISVSGSPVTTSGTLALTVAGTSGGVVYFSGAATWASSGVLASNDLMVGGGAGSPPATITTGTGVITALGVNTGSAGSVVLFNGALGTPSSGVATNLTGTASGLTAGNVTTNANLTGPITSVGNATAVAAQTGTGSTFVMQASPTLTTPNIGTPSAGTLTSCLGLPPGGLTFAATQRILGRNTALGGAGEEVTASQALDWIGSTRGQILYRNGGSWAALSPGTSGQFLRTAGAGADPSWNLVNLAATSEITGTLAAGNGGTGQSSYAVGDILYASGASALSKLAGVATGNALISGGVTTAPSWGKIGLTTHISGTLPIANGGTGDTTAAGAFTALKQAASDTATGVIEIATQAEMETGTSTTLAVTPGRVKYAPGVAKAFVKCDASGTIQTSYNVTSVTDTGTGLLTVTWDTDFSSADYVVQATALSGNQNFISANSMAAGSCAFICWVSNTAALGDPTNWLITAHGDQ